MKSAARSAMNHSHWGDIEEIEKAERNGEKVKRDTKLRGPMMNHRVSFAIVLALIGLWLLIAADAAAQTPGSVTDCRAPVNLSNSPGYVSADPILLADPGGRAHLFWAERTTGKPNAVPNVPDTMMYAVWDGQEWSQPIDIFISPPQIFNKRIAGMRAVLDEQGMIHLIWIGPDNTFYYSAAPAWMAGSANAWRPAMLLADDQTGTQYSAAIAYQPPQTLHVVYGRSPEGDNRSVVYIRSTDGGLNWSAPIDLYVAWSPQRGASNLRLLFEPPAKLYATWTEWDESGNGQAIYFVRSLDGGRTWDRPVLLDERRGDEYERDWTNLAVLEDGQLIALWEGGFRAYPQAQYSYDDGATWSPPIDTFRWLIADNGFAEFARDSQGRLHVFLSRRIREGNEGLCDRFPGCAAAPTSNTLWHSVWEGGINWREPWPFAGFYDSNFTAAAIVGGNRVAVAWFNYTALEVLATTCAIADAPALALRPWPTFTPSPMATATATKSAMTPTAAPPTRMAPILDLPAPSTGSQPGYGIAFLAGIAPPLLVIGILLAVRLSQRRPS